MAYTATPCNGVSYGSFLMALWIAIVREGPRSIGSVEVRSLQRIHVCFKLQEGLSFCLTVLGSNLVGVAGVFWSLAVGLNNALYLCLLFVSCSLSRAMIRAVISSALLRDSWEFFGVPFAA